MSTTVIWATIGIVLILAEVFTSTFVLLFFGVAALLVAGSKALGLDNLPVEIVAFGALGMLLTLTLRKKIQASFGRPELYRADEYVQLSEDIPPRGTKTISYQGTTWTAVNESDSALVRGGRAVVVRTEGVRLYLKAAD